MRVQEPETAVLECSRCGQLNRVRLAASGVPVCALCGTPLPAPGEHVPPHSPHSYDDGGEAERLDAATQWEAVLAERRAMQQTLVYRAWSHPAGKALIRAVTAVGVFWVVLWAVGFSLPTVAKETLASFIGFVRRTPVRPLKLDRSLNGSLEGKRLFPDDSPWNTRVDRAPVDPRSRLILSTIGTDVPLAAGFGGSSGFQYVLANSKTKRFPVMFMLNGRESDQGRYPVPSSASTIASQPGRGVLTPPEEDARRDIIVLDQGEGKLYELSQCIRRRMALRYLYQADGGAIFDIHSNRLRPKGWRSLDGAGLPVLPGLVRYDEVVEQQAIRHALRFTLLNSRKAFVAPARDHVGRLSSEKYPPMGMRVRLRPDFDLSPFPRHVRVVLKALQTYGMFLADHGKDLEISGTHDVRWSGLDFSTLKWVRARDLEVVRMSGIETDVD